ncbi:hypothetical protein FOZ60_003325 [Perkinsus olseni]|uniref:Uncharacterized protein n=1 Tax=Perkinsus olseni TaxID=32597 RepID=A0A7J6NVK0_PEROL|nr:hypothetical protein FOZ60_003325 [Perkinsus olseni]
MCMRASNAPGLIIACPMNLVQYRNALVIQETPGGAAGRELFKFFDGIEHENWMLKAKLGRLSSSGENLTAALRAAEQRAGSLQDKLNHILAREKDTVETQTEPLEQRSEQEELLKRKVQDLEEVLSAEKEKTATLSKEVDSVRAELRSAELQDTREEACRSVEEQKMAAERLQGRIWKTKKKKSEKNKENDAMAEVELKNRLLSEGENRMEKVSEWKVMVEKLSQELEESRRESSEREEQLRAVQKEVDHERGLSTRLNEQVKELQRQLEEVAEKSSVVEKTKELEEARDEVERLHVEVAGVRRDAEGPRGTSLEG